MSRKIRPAIVVAALGVVLAGAARVHAADLAAAKALYASASYEEALDQLKEIDAETDADDVQQYQALCLIALGRTAEAETVMEAMVTRNPLFSVADRDLSPRFLSMFEDVRARVLPTVARGLYAQAKRRFDQREFADAKRQFSTLLAVIGDRESDDDLLALKELAEGFEKLADASLPKTPARPAPAAGAPTTAQATQSATAPGSRPAPAVAPASQPPADGPTSDSRVIFTRDSADVRPPQALSQSLPPAPSALASKRLTGLLVLVVDEQGAVESASLSQSLSPLYDSELIAAARQWRFRPAQRNGVAVPYRLTFPLVIGR